MSAHAWKESSAILRKLILARNASCNERILSSFDERLMHVHLLLGEQNFEGRSHETDCTRTRVIYKRGETKLELQVQAAVL